MSFLYLRNERLRFCIISYTFLSTTKISLKVNYVAICWFVLAAEYQRE
jgi:hypothetical protein